MLIPVILAGILASPARTSAGYLPTAFDHIDARIGLSHNSVGAVVADSLGYRWFGTVDGLNRFDGYECMVFRHDPANSASLASNLVEGILVDSRGTLWVGTRDAGLCRMTMDERRTHRFTRFQHDPARPQSLSHPFAKVILEDSYGRLWVGTYGGGLNLFNAVDSSFRTFRRQAGDSISRVSDLIMTLFEDSQGLMWIGTESGVFTLDLHAVDEAESERGRLDVRRYSLPDGGPVDLQNCNVSSIFETQAGHIWLGTQDAGIFELDRKRNLRRHVRHLPGTGTDRGAFFQHVFHEDELGRLWIASTGAGLCVYDTLGGAFHHFEHKPGNIGSLSNNNISSVLVDKHSIYWIGTWGGGINVYDPHKEKFGRIRHNPDNANSLSNNFVYSLCEGRNATLWIATLGGGLNAWDRKRNLWTHYRDLPEPFGLPEDKIWTLHRGHSGRIWVGAESGGIFELQQAHSGRVRFRHMPHEPGNIRSPADNAIRSLYEDRSGRLWIGTQDHGISCYDIPNNTWRHFRHEPSNPHSVSHDCIREIYQDREGTLWFGTLNAGLNALVSAEQESDAKPRFVRYRHDKSDSASISSDDIRCVYQDSRGILWIASHSGGLNRFHPESGTFSAITETDGLPNNVVYAILEDDEAHLWLSTNRGLSRFDPLGNTFQNFSTVDGLQADEFNTRTACVGADGDMYFGGVNGLNYFNPADIRAKRNTHVPPVTVSEILVAGETLAADTVAEALRHLVLPHDFRSFSVEFVALDFHSPERNRYAYLLVGYDDTWIQAGARRYARYTNLPPGDYTFRVKAANNDGVWNEVGASLAIEIRPAFWQTWWFQVALALSIPLLLFALFRARKYYLAYRRENYIGRYKIKSLVGRGGMASVYRAYDRQQRQTLALKVFRSGIDDSDEGLRRFLQEAEIGRKIDHPNVVRIYEAGSSESLRYISMEYLDGTTLKQHIRTHAPLDPPAVLDIAVQICAGLEAIHASATVHRDIKADNLMLLPDGRVKIMDFGLAHAPVLTTISNSEQRMGTLSYMSPEQTLGKNVDFRSDIYSLGVLLYELLFGELPFTGNHEMELIFAIHNDIPPRFKSRGPGNTTGLDALILRCLEKVPQERYASVAEVRAALEHCRAVRSESIEK